MAFVSLSSFLRRSRNLRVSERLEPLRFYGGYLRRPLLLILLALMGEKLFYYGGLPLAGEVRREWAYQAAERAFAAHHDRAALAAIRQALLESRSDARFWRLAARISDQLNSPEAAYCWLQADRVEPGVPDTALALAEAALRQGRIEMADAALRELSPANQAGARYVLDAGQVAQAEGRPERARYWFEQAEAFHPTDIETLFVLARWHGGRAGASERTRSRELLLSLAARPTERPAALRLLVALDLRGHDFFAARKDETALLATPGATFADRVGQLDVAEACGTPADAPLAQLLHTATPAEAAQALDWMISHQRAEAALIWIRRQDQAWQDDPALAAARARALASLGDWEHLRDDQRDSVWPGDEPGRLMWLARASFELGDESEGRAAWHRAVAACAGPGDFEELERAADSFPASGDREDLKAEVWTAQADRYPGQDGPLRALLAYDWERGDLVAAQAISERLAALAPDAAALGADFDLIRLLRGCGTAQAATDLRRLASLAPTEPAVATAAAYALYLQGRFDEALATLGELDPAELAAPERAAILGQLLAVAGPVDRAQAALERARAQPTLLEQQQASVARSLDLVAYRRAMADWLHSPDNGVRQRAGNFFAGQAASGGPVFLIGESVTLASGRASRAEALAWVQPTQLTRAELLLYEGAVLHLAGRRAEAEPLLELSAPLPVETPETISHRAVETWWTMLNRGPFDPALAAGLLTAYRGLETANPTPDFWRRDAARELALARTALRQGLLAGALQERLEALARHVPATPELEAEIGYAFFLQGRTEAACERLSVLSPTERARPEVAFYDAALRRAEAAIPPPASDLLAARGPAGPKSR